jgi:hypothetical protein
MHGLWSLGSQTRETRSSPVSPLEPRKTGQTEETKVRATLISSAKGKKLHSRVLISSKILRGKPGASGLDLVEGVN